MATRVVLSRPGFRDLLIGQAVSSFGDWMGTVALMALVLDWSGYLGSHPYALALWLDGATYLVSFAFIRRLDMLGPASPVPAQGERATAPRGAWAGVVAALRLPIVRAVLPATVTAVIGVGALFSLGVVYVRQVLHASTGEFGGMVALFCAGVVMVLGAMSPEGLGSPERWRSPDNAGGVRR